MDLQKTLVQELARIERFDRYNEREPEEGREEKSVA
jgi:hypothetical protein